MEGTTTIKLKSHTDGAATVWKVPNEASKKCDDTKEKSAVNIIELRSRDDLDLLYQKMEPLDNTIIILHHLDLLNGATDLKPAAIFAAPCNRNRLSRLIQQLEARAQESVTRPAPVSKRQNKKNIIIYTHDGFEVIRTKEILHITAERAYCQIFLTKGRKITVSKPLREIEDQLSSCFFRTHHSHLVNLCKVVAYKKDAGGELVLKDGSRVPVARSRKEEVEGRLLRK
jgi:DNA-binding LytR/AlgR family response regulator